MMPPWWYWLVAIGCSIFYAICEFKIFEVSTSGKHWTWITHQVWLNFLGSASGWAALWLLYIRANQHGPFDAWNVGLFILAFIGITGHMPLTVVGLVMAPGEIFSKLVGAGK